MLTDRQAEVLGELLKPECSGLNYYRTGTTDLAYGCSPRFKRVHRRTFDALVVRKYIAEGEWKTVRGPSRFNITPAGREALAEWKKNKEKS